MTDIWARYVEPSGQPGPDYWNYFAERLVDLATIPKDAAILDIGTYDGNVLFKAMKRAGVRGYGVGIDTYDGGLKDGLTEAKNRKLKNAAFVQMDAATLGFQPETFHSVLANFVGWDYCFNFDRMEFTAPDHRTAEIRRVLKPGGQIGLGFWIKQDDIDWIAEAFRRYLSEYVEATGKDIAPYGKENLKGYEAILRSGGFHDVTVHVETTAFISPDTETWWRQMKHAAREYFDQVPDPAKLEHFQEQVFADLNQFRSPEGIRFNKTVSFAFATRF